MAQRGGSSTYHAKGSWLLDYLRDFDPSVERGECQISMSEPYTRRKAMQEKQPRKPRCDRGQIQLTERDLWVLRWIGEQYAVRLDHLQELLGQEAGRGAKQEGQISESAARLVVARWVRADLATWKKFMVNEPFWVWLTPRGLRELELPYKRYEPSLARLDHLCVINAVRLLLEEQLPDATWTSERTLRARLSYTKGGFLPHLPDAELISGAETIGIEVELTPKKPQELRGILGELTNRYHQVWYYVTSETRQAVMAASKQLEPWRAEKIRLTDCPEWGEEA
jgi:hypothetical protein